MTPTSTTGLGVSKTNTSVTPTHGSDGLDGSLETGQVTTGCGAFIGDYIGIASTSADVYLGWRVNHYLNLDDAMSEEMDERIASYMAWNRAQALPKYAQLADDARRRLERGLQPADLVWGYDSGVAQAQFHGTGGPSPIELF